MTQQQKDAGHQLQLQAFPSDDAMEQAVLGACLLDSRALPVVQDILTSADAFYNTAHQTVYTAMLQLHQGGSPVDLLTTTQHLRTFKTPAGHAPVDAYYLVQLTNKVASAANLEAHARVVKQYHVQRQVGLYALRMYNEANSQHTDVFDLLGACERGLMDINKGLPGGNADSLADITRQLLEQTERAMAASLRGEFTGVPSGIKSLDKETGGWQPGQLVVLAARPGMGKTSFAVNNLAAYPASLGIPVGVLSLEMVKLALTARIAAPMAGLSTKALRSGELTEDDLRRLVESCETVSRWPMFIDDEGGVNISKIRAKARQMVRKHGIKLLIIDYLQLITGSSSSGKENRTQEITEITMALKALAKELGLPIIALSQLSRSVETRADKRPLLSDLRDSGSIEQDSDDVLFLYRPAYYDANADNTTELIRSKCREGKLGTTYMEFLPQATRFVEQEEAWPGAFPGPAVQSDNVVVFSEPRHAQELDAFKHIPRQEPDTFPF